MAPPSSGRTPSATLCAGQAHLTNGRLSIAVSEFRSDGQAQRQGDPDAGSGPRSQLVTRVHTDMVQASRSPPRSVGSWPSSDHRGWCPGVRSDRAHLPVRRRTVGGATRSECVRFRPEYTSAGARKLQLEPLLLIRMNAVSPCRGSRPRVTGRSTCRDDETRFRASRADHEPR